MFPFFNCKIQSPLLPPKFPCKTVSINAYEVFEHLPNRNLSSLNSMHLSYVQLILISNPLGSGRKVGEFGRKRYKAVTKT